jgi:outer membrane protein TolC
MFVLSALKKPCHLTFAVFILAVFSLFSIQALAGEGTTEIVPHLDPIEIDRNLTLPKLVSLTMEKYPDGSWLKSLEDEAFAINEQAASWTAGSSQLILNYQTIYSFRLNYGTANVQIPLWNLGQRDATKKLATKAQDTAYTESASVKFRVTGLVRAALWDMAIAKVRYEQAKLDLETNKQIVDKAKRQVELGELARSDVLLAETEYLQRLSVFTQAEAELMHSRKRYSSLTQLTRAPANYEEKLVALKEVTQNHPALVAINEQIERKQAELDTIRLQGSGQTQIAAGILSDEGIDNRSNKAEFFNIGVNIPFGGAAHIAPKLAAVNVQIARLTADRDLLVRNLEQAHHEAEHNLEVNKAELKTANEQRRVSEELMVMMKIAYNAGEINLLDLFKIQSKTQQAVLSAKERSVMLQRDIAFYNQAVGVMP